MSAPRGRPRSFDRELAKERAMLLFWARGYDGVSTRELCVAMGISAPSLYSAFTSKKKLFDEVVGTYLDRFGGFVEEALEEQPDAGSAVRHLLLGAARLFTRPGCPAGCLVMNGATNYTPDSEEVVEELAAVRRGVGERLRRRIQADVDAGRLAPDVEVAQLATQVLAIWQGMAMLARDGADRENLEAMIESFIRTWPATRDPETVAAGG